MNVTIENCITNLADKLTNLEITEFLNLCILIIIILLIFHL